MILLPPKAKQYLSLFTPKTKPYSLVSQDLRKLTDSLQKRKNRKILEIVTASPFLELEDRDHLECMFEVYEKPELVEQLDLYKRHLNKGKLVAGVVKLLPDFH